MCVCLCARRVAVIRRGAHPSATTRAVDAVQGAARNPRRAVQPPTPPPSCLGRVPRAGRPPHKNRRPPGARAPPDQARRARANRRPPRQERRWAGPSLGPKSLGPRQAHTQRRGRAGVVVVGGGGEGGTAACMHARTPACMWHFVEATCTSGADTEARTHHVCQCMSAMCVCSSSATSLHVRVVPCGAPLASSAPCHEDHGRANVASGMLATKAVPNVVAHGDGCPPCRNG